jgi:hypothetical protein
VPAVLTVWVIYKSPADYPGAWVLRAHDLPGGQRQECHVCKSLEEARGLIPAGLSRLDRHPYDDPVIYETWL